jgi:hypothetical protein
MMSFEVDYGSRSGQICKLAEVNDKDSLSAYSYPLRSRRTHVIVVWPILSKDTIRCVKKRREVCFLS